MTKNEIITNVLNRLYKGERFITLEIQKENGLRDALDELKKRHLIEIEGDFYILTNTGYDAVETKLPYPECLSSSKNASSINITQIGHNIHAPVNHSDLSIKDRNRSIAPPKNKQNEHSKKVSIANGILSNIWTFILFVIVGIVIWYLTIKHPIF